MNWFFIASSVLISNIICCPSSIQEKFSCPNGDPVFEKAPTEKTNITKWCFEVLISTDGVPELEANYSSIAWNSNTSTEALVENQLEMDFALQRAKEKALRYNVINYDNWTIRTGSKTTYMMANWQPGQPDNRTLEGEPKNCFGFNSEGKFRNVFCIEVNSLSLDENGKWEFRIIGNLYMFAAGNYA